MVLIWEVQFVEHFELDKVFSDLRSLIEILITGFGEQSLGCSGSGNGAVEGLEENIYGLNEDWVDCING